MAKSAPSTWIVVADRQHARLLEATKTAHGRCHLELHSELKSSWEEKEHARPSPLGAKGEHSYASVGHEAEERVHRFVGEIEEWLGGQSRERRIGSMSVYCPAPLLGEIRRRWNKELQAKTETHELNIAHLPIAELAGHQAIRALVENGSPAG